MTCIFCDEENESESIEHIVSESFGNKDYVVKRGAVCDRCNAKFSSFEGKALANTVFAMERARLGVVTKKGSNVKGKVANLIIEGDQNFRKQFVTIKAINDNPLKDFDAETGEGQLFVASFDGSDVATSRLLLKIGLEAIFTSQRKVYTAFNFSELKEFLTNKNDRDWPFMTTDAELNKFISIPRFDDRYRLRQKNITLSISEFNNDTLLFKFKFGAIAMTINLLNRGLGWISDYIDIIGESEDYVYPAHYRSKIKKYRGLV